MSCGECSVISLYLMCFSVNGSICLVCCVFDSDCELFSETIRNMFGRGCYFMLLKCFVCVDELCWIDRVWSSTECACCTCDLSIPSICFVYVFVCRKLSPHLRV